MAAATARLRFRITLSAVAVTTRGRENMAVAAAAGVERGIARQQRVVVVHHHPGAADRRRRSPSSMTCLNRLFVEKQLLNALFGSWQNVTLGSVQLKPHQGRIRSQHAQRRQLTTCQCADSGTLQTSPSMTPHERNTEWTKQRDYQSQDHDIDVAKESTSVVQGIVVAAQANYVRVKALVPQSESERRTDSTAHTYGKAGSELLLCKVRTLLKKIGLKVLVGDKVELKRVDWDLKRGVVYNILPRASQLEDPAIVNVDQVIVVFAVQQPEIQPLQLTRFLLTAEASGLPVHLVVNKTDLCDPETLEYWETRLLSWGYNPVFLSVHSRAGMTELMRVLDSKVSVLAGPSGVGKSSLVNAIRNDHIDSILKESKDVCDQNVDHLNNRNIEERVRDVSHRTGLGKHTTRHVSLLNISNDGLLADTPGINLTSLMSIDDDQLPMLFPEIRYITGSDEASTNNTVLASTLQSRPCQFKDCSHITEPGCLVNGQNWERFQHYLYYRNEIKSLNRQKRNRKIKAISSMEEQHNNTSILYKEMNKGDRGQVHVPLLDRKKYRRKSRNIDKKELKDVVRRQLIIRDERDDNDDGQLNEKHES